MCYDGDGAEVYNEVPRRARKPHRCDECGRAIPVGSVYLHASGIQEGEPFSGKRHRDCLILWNAVHEDLCGGNGLVTIGGLSEEFGEYGVHFGDTVESLNEEWDGEPPFEVINALPYLRRFEAIRAKYPPWVRPSPISEGPR